MYLGINESEVAGPRQVGIWGYVSEIVWEQKRQKCGWVTDA